MTGRDPDELTPREREVLGLIRVGLTNEEIAERLGITLDGAKYHVSQILSKLGVATREEAAVAAAGEPPVRAPERRRWWAAWPLAAKAACAAVAVAAVAGLGVLAWGVLSETIGESEEPLPARQIEQQITPSESLTGSPNATPTTLLTPSATAAPPQGMNRFDGVTMTFDYPEDWFIGNSALPHFNEGRGDENVILQNFDSASLTATEGIPPGAIKMDFSSFPLSVASTPIIDGGYEELVIDNPSGAQFLLRRLEEGYWHIWGISEFGGYFFLVSVLMNTEGPALEAVEPTLTSWMLRLPE